MAGNDYLSLVQRQKHHGSAHFESTYSAVRVGVFYIGLWQPLANFADEQQRRAAQSQTLADWIAANRQALVKWLAKHGHHKPNGSGGAPTIAQITSSAAQFGITPAGCNPNQTVV